MNCRVIVRALFPDRFPDNPVRWDAAYRWVRNVGVDVVFVVEDGITDVPRAERTGCWTADFPAILVYKEAYYQQIAMNDWMRNVEGAVDAGLSREDAEEMMGPRPPAPVDGSGTEVFVDTAWKASGTKPREEAPQAVTEALQAGAGVSQPKDTRSLDDKIIDAFGDETYTGRDVLNISHVRECRNIWRFARIQSCGVCLARNLNAVGMNTRKQSKKPVRGSGFSVSLPTEPLAGAAKDQAIMAVLVPEGGLEFDLRLGQTIEFPCWWGDGSVHGAPRAGAGLGISHR